MVFHLDQNLSYLIFKENDQYSREYFEQMLFLLNINFVKKN